MCVLFSDSSTTKCPVPSTTPATTTPAIKTQATSLQATTTQAAPTPAITPTGIGIDTSLNTIINKSNVCSSRPRFDTIDY